MDRLFLDANVLFSAACKVDSRVFRLWQLKDVLPYSSRHALEEARFNLAEENQQRRLATLALRLHLREAPERQLPESVVLPPKDAPILLAAIEARAHYLVTGDFRDFGPYFGRRVEGVVIVSPSRYLKIREGAR
jgi:predicted nucleic acid-binding protein